MTTAAIQLPTMPTATAEPVRARPAPPPRDWGAMDDVEKGTLGGYTEPAREDLTFGDLLDLVNPLQHIPGVGHVYRALTGDTIKPAVRVAGSMLFGGPVGMLLGAGGAVAERMLGDPIARVADSVLGTNSARATAVAAVADDPAGHAASAGAEVAQAAAAPQPGPALLAELAEAPARQTAAPGPAPAPAPAAGAPDIGTQAVGAQDVGSAGEATLAALIAASDARAKAQAPGPAGPRAGYDLAAYAGGPPVRGTEPRGDARHVGGKSIRTYFEEAPRATIRRGAPAAAEQAQAPRAKTSGGTASAEAAGPQGAPAAAPAAALAEPVRTAPKAAVGSTVPTGAAAAGAADPRQVPPWFAQRVLDNLDRYGSDRRNGSDPAEG